MHSFATDDAGVEAVKLGVPLHAAEALKTEAKEACISALPCLASAFSFYGPSGAVDGPCKQRCMQRCSQTGVQFRTALHQNQFAMSQSLDPTLQSGFAIS